MNNLENIKFDEQGLVPAVVQDEQGKVLMLAYMNEESLQKTLATGTTWFFSRSRQSLWHKGETSGHFQYVKEVFYDCDGDTLLLKVNQTGSACHTGAYSCFYRQLELRGSNLATLDGGKPQEDYSVATILNDLYNVIQDRKLNPVEGSYTNYLFRHGQDKILKKIGEEATETVIASKNSDRDEILYEMADLWYHCLVLLAYHNISPNDLLGVLQSRRKGGAYHKFIDPDKA